MRGASRWSQARVAIGLLGWAAVSYAAHEARASVPCRTVCASSLCLDVFGAQRTCTPDDSPVPEPNVSHIATDVLGCDVQISKNATSGMFFSRQRCITTSTEVYSNTTCPWVQNIKTWTTIPDQLMCVDGYRCNTTDPASVGGGLSCCNDHGGRLRCPINFPYMCRSKDQCAGGQDRCCVLLADNCNEPVHKGLRPCNTTVTVSSTKCELDGCLQPHQIHQGAEETCDAVSNRTSLEDFSSAPSITSPSFTIGSTSSETYVYQKMYQRVLRDYNVDLKCLSCIRNGCHYCQILDRTNKSVLLESGSSVEQVRSSILAAAAGGNQYQTASRGAHVESSPRLSTRARCIADPTACARVPRFALADSVAVPVLREADCYRTHWHYVRYLADHQLPRIRPSLAAAPPTPPPYPPPVVNISLQEASLVAIQPAQASWTLSLQLLLKWSDTRLLSSTVNPCGAEIFDAEMLSGRRVTWQPSLARNTSVSVGGQIEHKRLNASLGTISLSLHSHADWLAHPTRTAVTGSEIHRFTASILYRDVALNEAGPWAGEARGEASSTAWKRDFVFALSCGNASIASGSLPPDVSVSDGGLGSDKVQVTTSGGEQVQGLQVKVQGEVEGYDVIVAHAYVDSIGFHLVVYCELVQTGRLFQIVAPLACIILMALAASSLSSGTPELLGPKILTNTLALLALSFFGSHPDLTFATSPYPSTSVPPPPWLVALSLGAQCLVLAVAVAACIAYRAYMSDTAQLHTVGINNLIAQAKLKDRQRLASLLETGLVGASLSVYVCMVLSLYFDAREPSEPQRRDLPQAVLKRMGQPGISRAMMILAGLLTCACIGPFVIEIMLHHCAWPWQRRAAQVQPKSGETAGSSHNNGDNSGASSEYRKKNGSEGWREKSEKQSWVSPEGSEPI